MMSANHSTASHFIPGAPRAYREAVSLGVIDRRIRGLVAAFNVPGVVTTLASCQGHYWPFLMVRETPYVMFRTTTSIAAKLAVLVRKDSLQAAHLAYLNYGWIVEGHFDDQGELQFTLRFGSSRFKRTRVDQDFEVLRQWVQPLFQPGANSHRVGAQ